MAQTIIQKILERIDERERLGDLDSGELADYPREDLQRLLDRGVLTENTVRAAGAVTTEYLDDGTREQRVFQSSPETFYEIVLPRILEAIREDNALKGCRRDFEDRLFDLGERRFRDLPPIRVWLSLRNREDVWFEKTCGRVGRGPKQPAVLLVPRWLPVPVDLEGHNQERGVTVLFLDEFLAGESWQLPWDECRHEVKIGLSADKGTIPGEPFPTQPGTTWGDVLITMTDLNLTVEAKGKVESFTFQEAGFEDKKRGNIPDSKWDFLTIIAARGGVLGSDDSSLDKTKERNLRQTVYDLNHRIKPLIPGIDGNPIRFDGHRNCYAAAFKVRSAEHTQFPTPAGTTWRGVHIAEVEPFVVRITVASTERFGVPSYENDVCRGDVAQRETSTEREYDFRALGLLNDNDKPSQVGELLLALLRNGGTLPRGEDDSEILTLGKYLCDLMTIDQTAFRHSRDGRSWEAKFDASSEVNPPR